MSIMVALAAQRRSCICYVSLFLEKIGLGNGRVCCAWCEETLYAIYASRCAERMNGPQNLPQGSLSLGHISQTRMN